jgi:hypothetical protein
MELSSISEPQLAHRNRAAFSLRSQEALAAALHLYDGVGQFLGGTVAVVTFLSIMLLAYGSFESFDLLLGLVVGWVGGLLAAVTVFTVLRFLWPVPLMLVLVMLVS